MPRRKIAKTKDGIPIYCGMTRLADPEELKPHPKAFRTHSRGQRALLAEIIEGNGWREPVTASARNGFVTRGYARVLAAQDRGWKQIPVDEQKYASEAAELADAIADTRIQEFSKLDDNKLRAIIERLQKKQFNLKLTGLDQNMIDAILANLTTTLQIDMRPLEGTGQDGIRQVILVLDQARYEQFTEAVARIQKKAAIASLSELCLNLLRERNETGNDRAQRNRATRLRTQRSGGKRRPAKDNGAVQSI